MYEEFLKQIEDFMFIEDKPEKADVIFVPGNGYPNRYKKSIDFENCFQNSSNADRFGLISVINTSIYFFIPIIVHT